MAADGLQLVEITQSADRKGDGSSEASDLLIIGVVDISDDVVFARRNLSGKFDNLLDGLVAGFNRACHVDVSDLLAEIGCHRHEPDETVLNSHLDVGALPDCFLDGAAGLDKKLLASLGRVGIEVDLLDGDLVVAVVAVTELEGRVAGDLVAAVQDAQSRCRHEAEAEQAESGGELHGERSAERKHVC